MYTCYYNTIVSIVLTRISAGILFNVNDRNNREEFDCYFRENFLKCETIKVLI